MQVIDKHLQILAQQHLETKFVKVCHSSLSHNTCTQGFMAKSQPLQVHTVINLALKAKAALLCRQGQHTCVHQQLTCKHHRIAAAAIFVRAGQTTGVPLQIHAEKSPFLVERLKIWMLPTLALIRQENTVDYVVGFEDLGGKDDFTTEVRLWSSVFSTA